MGKPFKQQVKDSLTKTFDQNYAEASIWEKVIYWLGFLAVCVIIAAMLLNA